MALLWGLVFIVSLFFLIKSADYLVKSAEKIGLFFRISPFIIGITVVSIGTSLPELVSSLFAVFRNSPDFVVGNVLGSNIANILLVIGLAAVIGKKLKIDHEIMSVDLPFFIGTAFFVGITLWDGNFQFFEAVLAILAIIVYLIYTMKFRQEHPEDPMEKEIESVFNFKRIRQLGLTPFILLASAIGIYFSADYFVKSVIELGTELGISTGIISITAVAVGTSLPELIVSVKAALQKKTELAIGNVLGSNIFNSFVVLGIPGLFKTLPVSDLMLYTGIPFMIIASFLFLFMTQDKSVTRWEGWILLIFYALFICKIFI